MDIIVKREGFQIIQNVLNLKSTLAISKKKFFILSTVRILRSVTPRTFSARLARSRWKQQPDREDNVSSMRPPRIFEIVQEQHDVSGVAQR